MAYLGPRIFTLWDTPLCSRSLELSISHSWDRVAENHTCTTVGPACQPLSPGPPGHMTGPPTPGAGKYADGDTWGSPLPPT